MMAMVISTNTASINAQRHLNASRQDLDVAMERLSSGQRINSAADDAAGLAIRDKMTSQVEGLNQAVRNANDAISFMQSAEGALEETTNILQRMRTLAVQAVNDTNSSSDRLNLNAEIGKLQEEITRIGNTSTFNNKNLIDGSMNKSIFQIGHMTGQTIEVQLNDMRSEALGAKGATSGATFETKEITVAGAFTTSATTAGTISLTLGSDSVTYTASSAQTGAQALAAMTTSLTEQLGTKYSFSTEGNILTVTSKTEGVAGRFTSAVTVAAGTAGTATASLTETVDGVEAVAVAETSVAGFAGELGSGGVVSLTFTANGAAKTITHTNSSTDTIMDANAIVTALAGKISDSYTFKASGNSLEITAKTSGSTGAFTLLIKDDKATGGTLASDGAGIVIEETARVVAKDGLAASSSTTISKISVLNSSAAASAIDTIDNALQSVGQERSKLGAFQNRLSHAVNNMTNMSANTAAAKSVVADADYAAESSSLAKNQILQQAGTAMLAQANAQAQSVLSLLK
jgi:flagellin